MSLATQRRPRAFSPYLRLGRVSNLPTIWTNVLAATALARVDPFSGRTLAVLLAMTLFYLGGMYLNDAFDREIDARERPGRPIPAGEVAARTVFAAGFALLGGGVVLLSLLGWQAGLAGGALAAVILFYDTHHKGNALSPVVMGLARALVYIGAALAASGAVPGAVVLGAVALLCHVAGLTYAARGESENRIGRLWPLALLAVPLIMAVPLLAAGFYEFFLWAGLAAADMKAVRGLRRRRRPDSVPRAVGGLIAAICLVDAVLAASAGAEGVAFLCLLAYSLTRLSHRLVPGT